MGDLTVHDALVPERARALADLLDTRAPDPLLGEGLPLMWHLTHFWDHFRQSAMGRDGHHAEPSSGMRFEGRRMFAGGRVRQARELRFDEPATLRARVLAVREKLGRSGPLTFVTVGRVISQRGVAVITENQEVVYRLATSASPSFQTEHEASPTHRQTWGDQAVRLETSPTLLFRFSALTYNAHRIHYDRSYATEDEGYPGLLVHGPLQALAMAEAIRSVAPEVVRRQSIDFEYRLLSPLFDHEGLVATASPAEGAWLARAGSRDGRLTARATLRVV